MTFQAIATPYGAAALAALHGVLRDLKRDDPMAPVTLLVPNNLAGIVARRHLAAGLTPDHPGVAGISLATLPRLAEQIGAPGLHPRRPATTPIVSAAWRVMLDSRPSVFEPVKTHPATIRALVAAHRELRDLSESALDAVAAGSRLAGELVGLHRDVVASLCRAWYDLNDLLDAATAWISTDSRPLDLGGLVLYLPQQLGRAEARFAKGLAATAGISAVVGLTGVRRADSVVLESLDRLGIGLPDGAPKARTAHRVLHASDSDDEVRCIVREVVASLDQTPAHRIAVLYGSAQPYARLLHEHLAAAGITTNGAGTRPVAERAIARGFLDILRLAERDLPRAAFFTAISEAPTRSFDGARAPSSRWERLSRSAAVVGGDDWDRRLTLYARSVSDELAAEEGSDDPSPARIDGYRRDIDNAAGLRQFAMGLRDRLRQGRALTDWTALSDWAAGLLAELYGGEQEMAQLPAEEQYAAVALASAIHGLADLAAFEASADLGGAIDALTLELEAALPRVGRFGDGLLVAPLSAAVGLDADVVYVVGLAEDSYPGRMAEDALLRDDVRARSGGELASYRDRVGAKQRHLLAAFDAAPLVVASFPRGDLRRSTQRLPSRWLLPTLRELTGDHELSATDWESARCPEISSSPSYALSLVSQRLPVTEQEWRTQSAVLGRALEDPTVDAATEVIEARASAAFTRYDGNLAGAEALPNFADGRRLVSPTALESYATCPHAYFVKRMLRIEPVEQPEEIISISALDIGNLIHRAMDAFITECGDSLPGFGEPWTAAQRLRLREIAGELAAEFEEHGLTGHRSLWLTERDRIIGDLDAMLDYDDVRRGEQAARVVRSELAFGFHGAEPVLVSVPQGVVAFRGSADKVDEKADGTLVVTDIKTGGTSRFAAINRDPLVAGTKLQLPVYAQAARQLLHAKRAEAAYWFVRQGKRDWIDVELTEDLHTRFGQAVGTLVGAIAAGQFPAKAPEQPDFLWVQCPYCNPDGIGHGEARTRWERKRHDPGLAELVGLVDPEADAR